MTAERGTTLNVDGATKTRLKMASAETGIPMQEIAEEAIREYLIGRSKSEKTLSTVVTGDSVRLDWTQLTIDGVTVTTDELVFIVQCVRLFRLPAKSGARKLVAALYESAIEGRPVNARTAREALRAPILGTPKSRKAAGSTRTGADPSPTERGNGSTEGESN